MDVLIMTMMTCLLLISNHDILQKKKVKIFNLKCGGLAKFSAVFSYWELLIFFMKQNTNIRIHIHIQTHEIQLVAGSHTLFGLQSNETH